MKNSEFVSRAGEKLDFALDYFKINVENKIAADFGSSTGGFIDCLLKKGIAKIYSLDTTDKMLNSSFRNNPKVEVIIGNAMHFKLKEKVDLVTIDVGWTRQELVIPNALENLKENGDIISLIKPQYEADKKWLMKGVVKEEFLGPVLDKIRRDLKKHSNLKIIEIVKSPLKGTKGKNVEYLMWCKKI